MQLRSGTNDTPALGQLHSQSGVYNADPVGASSDVTALLLAWGRGEQTALNRLLPLVHEELRRVARRHMAGERGGDTLQPTALVNEAYLRLVDLQRIQWQNRAHFFAMAARIMRRVLVDIARGKAYQKRGGGAQRVTFIESRSPAKEPEYELIALNDALETLAKLDERKSRVVELRYFGGLTLEETAEALGISRLTVIRDWQFSKDWLKREIRRGAPRDA
jgi:RNA polymerase sigma-70 factor, ECF subfamily